MNFTGRFIIICLALLLMAIVLLLMRRRAMEVEYGVAWLGGAAVTIFFMAAERVLLKVTHLLGAIYPVSALSLMTFVVIIAFLVFLTARISILSVRLRTMAQYMALKDESASGTQAGCAPPSEHQECRS
ncbi:MAG: DUF2304 domain-containing protein [Deltaproteobacteria bacterium]|nr:DUF2304 domain-containing protein [Deltaproteobacteria bacterium]